MVGTSNLLSIRMLLWPSRLIDNVLKTLCKTNHVFQLSAGVVSGKNDIVWNLQTRFVLVLRVHLNYAWIKVSSELNT